MGCKESKPNSGTGDGHKIISATCVFGTGVHVGRSGNVDLTGRKLLYLGPEMINMINNDKLQRTATSLTLTDNKLYTLGKELSLLPNLEEIDIEANKFHHLPENLALLARLWHINASINPLDATRGFDVLPRLISLRTLSLRGCTLNNVPTHLFECRLLEDLDLSDNPSIHVGDGNFLKLRNLHTLRVAACGLKGNKLPDNITALTTLVTLDISSNQFSDFDEQSFFGKNIPNTLKSLHLRALSLTSVPQVVASLKVLNSLDLALNPIETLDVLAGRLVRRLPHHPSSSVFSSPMTTPSISVQGVSGMASSVVHKAEEALSVENTASPQTSSWRHNHTANQDDIDCSDGRMSVDSHFSMSKLSKAGRIATISHPIPLRKLSLRGCFLRTVPKYFHKLTELEELDLSENDNLDDVNMTLFSLQNLKSLNIVGCPFAVNPEKSRSEWFDIAKLRKLRDLQWEVWLGTHNMSPYRTRIPIEICSIPLEKINLMPLRKGLFIGETVNTVINLLRDGYFRVDLSLDDEDVYSYLETIHVFEKAKPFFFPKDVALSDQTAMQAANYDAIIIPPLDVIIIHYAQFTMDPIKYRLDCEAISGRILNCNYRRFFLELKRHPAAAKEAVEASKRVWNLMVRSAQIKLEWLRYNYWDLRDRKAAKHAEKASPSAPQELAPDAEEETLRLQRLPVDLRGSNRDEILADFDELRGVDSTQDLCYVLDHAITSYFFETDNENFLTSIQEFFLYRNRFLMHENALRTLTWDWTSYVKYLALYAYHIVVSHKSTTTNTVEPIMNSQDKLLSLLSIDERRLSVLGPRYDNLYEEKSTNLGMYLPLPPQRGKTDLNLHSRTSKLGSTLSSHNSLTTWHSEIYQLKTHPVPILSTALLLHAHRSTHVKYFQTLSLLGIENVDITLRESNRGVEETKRAWEMLYKECYLLKRNNYVFNFHNDTVDSTASVCTGNDGGKATSSHLPNPEHPVAPLFKAEERKLHTYLPNLKPNKSILLKHNTKRSLSNAKRKVLLSCGDSEYGVF